MAEPNLQHLPHVVSDADIMGGEPCLAGSRLPVKTLLAMVDAGDTWERIVESWPWLTHAHVEAARAWRLEREHPVAEQGLHGSLDGFLVCDEKLARALADIDFDPPRSNCSGRDVDGD